MVGDARLSRHHSQNLRKTIHGNFFFFSWVGDGIHFPSNPTVLFYFQSSVPSLFNAPPKPFCSPLLELINVFVWMVLWRTGGHRCCRNVFVLFCFLCMWIFHFDVESSCLASDFSIFLSFLGGFFLASIISYPIHLRAINKLSLLLMIGQEINMREPFKLRTTICIRKQDVDAM